jgi:capsular polysaccharide biosynthesis protein
MRIDEDGGHGGRGQSLLSLGEALSEPAPAGPSRLAQAIAQVRAERGIAPPREAAQPVPHHEPPPAATPRISPLLEALAVEPQAQQRPLPPPPAEDWPRERSTGEVPPLLSAASQWPEKRPVYPASKVQPKSPPAVEESDPERVDDTPPASPIAAAVAAVKAVHAAKETRTEAQATAVPESASSRQSQEKLPFPALEPFPVAQPGEAFWSDAARVLGLEDPDEQAGTSAARTAAPVARRGRAGASPSTEFSAGGVIAGLRRSLGLIMAATIAGTLLGGGAALMTPRTYSSTAELLADGRGVASDAAAQQPAMPDEALRVMVENQLRILRSQSLLAEVADRLKLSDDPEFDGTADGMSLSALAQIISGGPSNVDPERRKLIAAQALARSLAITRDGASFVIDITATTRDPDKSALIANTLADTFLATGGQDGAKGAVRVLADPSSSEAAPANAPQATRIMSRAMPALASNPPSRVSIIFKGLALGLIAGLGLALLQMVRRYFAASQPQEDAAPVAVPRQAARANPSAERQAAARREAPPPRAATEPSRAEAVDRMTNPPEPVAHPAPEEDRPMQRSPYRRSNESYPAASAGQGSYQDRHQPSNYRQAPMRPAAYAPQPGPSAYPQDAGDPRRAARSAEPYWQQPMPATPPQNWGNAPQPPHPGQQQMLHPHQYPMQSRPLDYAPAMPPQPQAYAPAPGYGPYVEPAPAYGSYGEPAPTYGREPSGPGFPAARYGDRDASAYGPEPVGRRPYDPRYDHAQFLYGAETMGPQDPRTGGQLPSAYRPEPIRMAARDPRYGDHAPHAYASQEPQNWQAQPRETDQSIEEIRATLRECREAIRDLGDKRTRRRYF